MVWASFRGFVPCRAERLLNAEVDIVGLREGRKPGANLSLPEDQRNLGRVLSIMSTRFFGIFLIDASTLPDSYQGLREELHNMWWSEKKIEYRTYCPESCSDGDHQ